MTDEDEDEFIKNNELILRTFNKLRETSKKYEDIINKLEKENKELRQTISNSLKLIKNVIDNHCKDRSKFVKNI